MFFGPRSCSSHAVKVSLRRMSMLFSFLAAQVCDILVSHQPHTLFRQNYFPVSTILMVLKIVPKANFVITFLPLRQINPLYLNISIHVLNTFLSKSLMVLTRRIRLTIRSFFKLVIISFLFLTFVFNSRKMLQRKIN